MSDNVLKITENYVTKIILNKPETGNLINKDNMLSLSDSLKEAVDSKDCRVIVIQGKDGIFCNGLDFSEVIENIGDEITKEFIEPYKDVLKIINTSPKPVIAAIDGSVLAGGMGIMLASDVIVATRTSKFGFSEVLFGLIPALVFPFLLERVSFKKARYLTLTSKNFYAEEAYSIGIIDDIAEDSEDLEKIVSRHLKRFLYSSPDALFLVKEYSDKLTESRINSSVEYAQDVLLRLLNNKRNTNAIKMFLEGGLPDWAVRLKTRGKK